MSNSFDILQIGASGGKNLRVFTIRWYRGDTGLLSVSRNFFRKRLLGEGRVAYDMGPIAFVFERYDC